jgi:hypothetical protein
MYSADFREVKNCPYLFRWALGIDSTNAAVAAYAFSRDVISLAKVRKKTGKKVIFEEKLIAGSVF